MGIKVNWGITLLAALLAGCGKPMPDEFKRLDPETRALRQDVNMFAWDVMDTYYLWRAKKAVEAAPEAAEAPAAEAPAAE